MLTSFMLRKAIQDEAIHAHNELRIDIMAFLVVVDKTTQRRDTRYRLKCFKYLSAQA